MSWQSRDTRLSSILLRVHLSWSPSCLRCLYLWGFILLQDSRKQPGITEAKLSVNALHISSSPNTHGQADTRTPPASGYTPRCSATRTHTHTMCRWKQQTVELKGGKAPRQPLKQTRMQFCSDLCVCVWGEDKLLHTHTLSNRPAANRFEGEREKEGWGYERSFLCLLLCGLIIDSQSKY